MLSLFFIVGLLLSGCGPIYQTTYSYQPPRAQMGKMCISQCFQTKSMCQQMCQTQDQSCRTQEHQNAYFRYQAYHAQQVSRGKPVNKSINDFDNSFSVCQHSCSCTADFNMCYQSCGGSVLEHRECTAFCG
jgi:uncharacterized protein YceK